MQMVRGQRQGLPNRPPEPPHNSLRLPEVRGHRPAHRLRRLPRLQDHHYPTRRGVREVGGGGVRTGEGDTGGDEGDRGGEQRGDADVYYREGLGGRRGE